MKSWKEVIIENFVLQKFPAIRYVSSPSNPIPYTYVPICISLSVIYLHSFNSLTKNLAESTDISLCSYYATIVLNTCFIIRKCPYMEMSKEESLVNSNCLIIFTVVANSSKVLRWMINSYLEFGLTVNTNHSTIHQNINFIDSSSHSFPPFQYSHIIILQVMTPQG